LLGFYRSPAPPLPDAAVAIATAWFLVTGVLCTSKISCLPGRYQGLGVCISAHLSGKQAIHASGSDQYRHVAVDSEPYARRHRVQVKEPHRVGEGLLGQRPVRAADDQRLSVVWCLLVNEMVGSSVMRSRCTAHQCALRADTALGAVPAQL
jgi:hypothetical protein